MSSVIIQMLFKSMNIQRNFKKLHIKSVMNYKRQLSINVISLEMCIHEMPPFNSIQMYIQRDE